ncbi:MAG TPA: carbamoyltransferase N-terminal domain-containing protein, partial [Vicinamibacterales bacterium]|nr:carbamoyltransferase N-terminal domain-containing protein [Vicinamibacterales bacterium]
MLTLGLSGGLDLLDQDRRYLFPLGSYHDSAAALVDDGRVVAAVEEERLNRIKHTSKGAISAIRFCLDRRCAQLRDLDALVIYGDEHLWERTLRGIYVTQVHAAPVMTPRALVHQMLVRGLGSDIDDSKLVFVRHHLAHALSTYLQSGFESSLVLTIDGGGDDLSGSMTDASDGSMRTLQTFSMVQSLGFFYTSVVAFLGFGLHEEYKVMGLAPYGNPRKYRSQFQSLYELHPQGNYVIRWDRFPALTEIGMPRKKGEPITEFHQDAAAALQEALEHIVAHVLTHYRWLTQHRRLCMAGGVAHNCSLNGKILYSGLFDEVFVHPASHDAGCAIGAALYPFTGEPGRSIGADAGSAAGNAVSIRSVPNRTALEHVYWGPDIGTADAIRQELAEWGDVIECESPDDISARAARLLADGSVIGWARGASEFGPR